MTPDHPNNPGLFSWGKYRIPGGEDLSFQVGALRIFIRKEKDEIRIAHIRSPEGEPRPTPPAEKNDWVRWGASGSSEEVEILPLFPDRPLVLQPENPFRLLPDARARIFVRVPLWVQVKVPGAKGGVLLEIPTLTLSDTWWGGLQDGELAYWLAIHARRAATSDIFLADRILCPLSLVNRATEELPVEKLLLRVAHLGVYRGHGSLWSDEIHVRYRGEEEGSDLEMTGRPPAEAPAAPRLTPPRVPGTKGFTALTFSRLRALPGFRDAF